MTTFQIREARAEDAAALAELRYAFRAELHGATEDRDPFVRRCTEWMASHLADGSWHCWVAEFGDGGRGSAAAIAACIWTEIVGKLPNPNGHLERHAYVSSRGPGAPRRRVGIAAPANGDRVVRRAGRGLDLSMAERAQQAAL